MSFMRLILHGLMYHRRLHAGVFAGTLIACAILTGALLMGDSVDGTLRAIAAARLGGITYAMDWGNRFFGQGLAQRPLEKDAHVELSALLALRGMAALPPERAAQGNQLNKVQVIGVEPGFWRFAEQGGFRPALGPQEAAINEKTAKALGLKTGDDLSLRIVKYGTMPLDAPLASREKELSVNSLLTVKAILPDEQLGRFSLAANQSTPYNVFVSRDWLQELTGLGGLANVLLADGKAPLAHLQESLNASWQLDDLGLRLRAHASGCLQLESAHIFLEAEVVRAALLLPEAEPTLTYLVNSIAKGDRITPYSFVEAGPVPKDLREDEVVINQWLAEQLDAKPGDALDMAYLQLLPANTFEERRHRFTVRAVRSMDELAVERELAPQFPGLSNVESCRDWQIGMPMDAGRLNDPANEAYWKQYKQTPKLLCTFKTGEALWGNRFGSVTAIRFPASGNSEADLRTRLRKEISAEKLGLRFLPVKQMAGEAVAQATDFGGLFAGMSFFLIVAALLLLGLLYLFGLQQRAREMGILLALGFTPGRVRALFLCEALPPALAGLLIGCAAGAGYARLLLAGLARYWPAAVAGTPIGFHARPSTLLLGGALSLLCVLLVVALGVWRGTRRAPRELLTEDWASAAGRDRRGSGRWLLMGSTLALLLAVATLAYLYFAKPPSLIEPFFSVGTFLLMAALGYYGCFLGYLARRPSAQRPRLWKMALANLARRRGRSLSVAALTACGCFLVFSVSSMRENPALHAEQRASGTGGFGLFAESTVPITGAPQEIARTLGVEAIPLRVHDGDDAGCLNLNRARVPRLLGVNPEQFAGPGAFCDAATWRLLTQESPDGTVPALVGDADTAMWGLKKRTGPNGDTLTYRDESGKDVTLRLVGQLPMRVSLFQGSVLIADASFTRLFPSEAGFRAFLLDVPAGRVTETVQRLNRDFERFGMQAVSAVERLAEFHAMEDTYLSMFLVLGALGLVLGAGGTGIVVLRNVFERRGELALLSAVGYPRTTLFRMLLAEHGLLILSGVFLGTASAAAAMLPLVLFSQTTVSPLLQGGLFLLITVSNLAVVQLAVRLGFPAVPVQALREE